MILLERGRQLGPGASRPHAVVVASATVDYSAQVTNVTLQAPAVTPPPAVHATIEPAPASRPRPRRPRSTSCSAGGLGKPTAPVPASANHLPQTAQSVFSAGSDAVPRLLSARCNPRVAPTLYAALGTTPVGSPPVTGASALQVKAAPFGASAPPQPVFNAQRPARRHPGLADRGRVHAAAERHRGATSCRLLTGGPEWRWADPSRTSRLAL